MIWLIPIQDRKTHLESQLLDTLCKALQATFDQECRIQRPVKPPTFGRVAGSNRYTGARLLEALPVQEDTMILGVTNLDLSMIGFDYTTGLSDLPNHRALIGIFRLHSLSDDTDENEDRFSARVVKRAIHELGHTFGLPHCQDSHCVMNLSDTLEEIDQKGDSFCERCEAALNERSEIVS